MPASTWDPANKSTLLTLSNGNLTATMNTPSGGTRAAVRSTNARASGKRYFEVDIGGFDGPGGWNLAVGNASQSVNASVGATQNSISSNYVGGGATSTFFNGSNLGSNGSSASDTVLEVAVDLDGLLFWCRGNVSGLWNGTSIPNPATGTNGISFAGYTGPSFIWFCAFGDTPIDIATLNVGTVAFSGVVPVGFEGWDVVTPANSASSFFTVLKR